MTKILIVESQRFEGDFRLTIATGAHAVPEEQYYIDSTNELLDSLASEEAAQDSEIKRQLIRHRDDFLKRIDEIAREVAAADKEAERAKLCREGERDSHKYYGFYLDRCDLVKQSPFSVIGVEKNGLLEDVDIRVLDKPIPADKQKLKVAIDGALAIIRAVLSERIDKKKETTAVSDAKRRLHYYLRALTGIARVGLVNSDASQVELGRLALEGLKNDFVTREAGFVKNSYVFWLGVYALGAIVFSIAAYVLMQFVSESISDKHKNFLLLFVGASIGTWLSFSLRRVALTFDDLAVLEEDRLKPQYRILFTIGLTFVAGLLFFTSAIQITIGNFTTDMSQAAAALLIGALCGIAERAMASAVARRADEFAAGVGGKTTGP